MFASSSVRDIYLVVAVLTLVLEKSLSYHLDGLVILLLIIIFGTEKILLVLTHLHRCAYWLVYSQTPAIIQSRDRN